MVLYRYLRLTISGLLGLALYKNTGAQYSDYSRNSIIHNMKDVDTSILQKQIEKTALIRFSRPDSALHILQYTREQSRAQHYTFGIITSSMYMINALDVLGRYEEALNISLQALTLCARDNGRSRRYFSVFGNNIGVMYRRMGKYDDAATYFYEALKFAETHPQSFLPKETLYLNIGSLHLSNGRQTDKALDYLDRAEYIAVHNKNTAVHGVTLLNKGMAWHYKAIVSGSAYDIHQSILFYEKALSLGLQHRDSLLQFRALNGLAAVTLKEDSAGKALAYYSRAEHLFPDGDKDLYQKGYNLITGGTIWMELGDYDKAAYYLERALKLAQKGEVTVIHKTLYESLVELYTNTGQYKKALEFQQKLQALQDSTLSENIQSAVNQMEVKYRTAEKDKALAQHSLKIIQQQHALSRKNAVIGGIAITVVLLTLAAVVYYRNKRKWELQKVQSERLKALVDGEEKERTRLARELHDGIGGMLTGIKMNLTALQGKDDTGQLKEGMQQAILQLQEMGEEIHQTAHNLMPELLRKYGLQRALIMYCGQLEMSGKLKVDLQFLGDTECIPRDLELPVYRIIQELLQNVVKHAQTGNAAIQIKVEASKLYISVEDDGIGFDSKTDKTGLGLENINTRIAAINGFCTIESEPGRGTTVFIEINLER